MVQLQLLTGNRSGAVFRSDHFPIRAGRAPESDLSLDEPGVWQRHFVIDWRAEGLILEAEPEALLSINDTSVQRALLRNGDIITLGASKIRVSLSPVRQSSLAPREWLTWIALGALCLGQVALVYELIR
ncbi:MAG TPA: FHA domain-containing protein [Verrucomicrobiae bacterium]|nr:FHA domain-containing protein [Verrucomicrobiae bacterium]